MYTTNKGKSALDFDDSRATTDAPPEYEVHHHSDGSELIPAEAQDRMRRHDGQLLDAPLKDGYTVDDEGLLNAYAMEPAMYFAEYPTPKQQRRYLIQGAIAILAVLLAVFFAVSVG